jgi:hypothetical protein
MEEKHFSDAVTKGTGQRERERGGCGKAAVISDLR